MEEFLQEFFPQVVDHIEGSTVSHYCVYDDTKLADFTASLYGGGFLGTISAAFFSRYCGRRPAIIIGGACFLSGSIVGSASFTIPHLVIARLFMGFGIGFLNQAVPIYLSEMSNEKHHLALEILLELGLSVGVFLANVVLYASGRLPEWGWRLAMGLSAIPGVFVVLVAIFLPETPYSLIQLGKLEKAKIVLTKRAGPEEAIVQFDEIMESVEAENEIRRPYLQLFKAEYRPQLVMAICMPLFTQATGISSVMFFGPVLFQAIGYTPHSSELYAAVTIGAVYTVCTLVSIAIVHKFNHNVLMYEAGLQMIIALVAIGVLLRYRLDRYENPQHWVTVAIISWMCVYVAGYTWSWGPLSWRIPTQITPRELLLTTHNFTLTANYLFTFAAWRSFLKLLCIFQFGLFFYYAGCVLVMTIFVILFLPETKDLQPEELGKVWKKHWFWKRVVRIPAARVNPFSDTSQSGRSPSTVEQPHPVAVTVPKTNSNGSRIEYDFNWNLY